MLPYFKDFKENTKHTSQINENWNELMMIVVEILQEPELVAS